jgi:hypothetical protein
MKKVLKFIGVLTLFFLWVKLVDLSFYLMNQPDDILFYIGFLMLALITTGPILYFGENIIMFFRNMKGVFSNEEKKDEK